MEKEGKENEREFLREIESNLRNTRERERAGYLRNGARARGGGGGGNLGGWETRFREIKGDKARNYKGFISLDGAPRGANGGTRLAHVSVFQCGKHNYRVTSSPRVALPSTARPLLSLFSSTVLPRKSCR